MSRTFYDKSGNKQVLAEFSEIIAKHMTFYSSTTNSVQVGVKGVTLIAIALNGSLGVIFDVIYHCDGQIVKAINLGTKSGTYALSGTTLTVSGIALYSEGFVITSPA